MALDNYSNLQAHIIRVSGRNDIATILPDFIAEAEAEMYANTNEALRLRAMEVRSTASTVTTDRFLELPEGFLEMRRLKINLVDQNDVDIDFRTPDQLVTRDLAGRPEYFTVTSQLEFERTPDEAYTLSMQYLARPTPLSDTNTTNAVLAQFPLIYVYGALWNVNVFAAEEQKSDFFYNKFLNSIAGANAQDREGRYGPAPVKRIQGWTP